MSFIRKIFLKIQVMAVKSLVRFKVAVDTDGEESHTRES